MRAAIPVAAQMEGQLGSCSLLFRTLPQEPAQPAAVKIPKCAKLRLVLGDQLNIRHSWFENPEEDVLYLVAELHQEATYTRHHVQKVAAFFLAMQAFAKTLSERGHHVLYLDLDQTAAFESLEALLKHLLRESGAQCFEYQRPDEYRLLSQLEKFCDSLDIPTQCRRSEHFLLRFGEIPQHFEKDKSHRMEAFYRRMRKSLRILVDEDGNPHGGEWNYDAENREKLPKDIDLPEPLLFGNSADEIHERLERHAIETIGRRGDGQVNWPVTREQSLELLEHFVSVLLPRFGPYQDALSKRDWVLFHSRLSFSMNTKMLSPAEVISAVLEAWGDSEGIPLSSVEGFIRQIIGWREFMRGMYWANMPEFGRTNALDHQRDLPGFYWDGDTRMACMAHAIGQSLDHAYAHHIQRLMVTGNFALLAGIDPDQVDDWYLGVYADAVEWVEMPNTRGMSQFADGGLIASKPYCASGQYIRRMGDHCSGCHYAVSKRSGEGSCPFNSLYWHFMSRNEQALSGNPRMAMPYRNWQRMGDEDKQDILETAERYLADLSSL